MLIFNLYCLVGQVTFFLLIGKWTMLIFPRLLGKWARSHRARFSFRLKLKVHCAFAYIRTCKGTHAYASIFSYVRICLRTCVRTSVPMRTHDVQTEAYERVMRTWVRPCIRLFLKKESRAKLLVKKNSFAQLHN